MQLLRSMSIYTVTNLLGSAIPFLLLPVLTRYLSPADYGMLSVVNTIVTFMFPLTVLGIGTALYIDYFKLSKEELPVYTSSIICVPLVMSVLMLCCFTLSAGQLATYFNVPRFWMMLVPVMVLLQVFPYLVCIFFQVRKEAGKFGRFQIGLTVVNFGLSLLLLVGLQMGWVGRLYGMYIAYGLFSVVALLLIWRMGYLVPACHRNHVKHALAVGIPLIPHELGVTMINMSDRLFITKMVGLEAVGNYSIGYQVGMIMYMFSSSFNQAWAPHLFETLVSATEYTKAKLVKQSYLFMSVLVAAFGALYVIAPLIFRVFINEKFSGAFAYVFWVALGYVLYGMYIMIVNYIYFVKKTYLLTYLTLGNGIVNLVLNYLFISRFGAIGAAYATTLSFFLFFLVAWWLSNKVYPMPWFSFYKKIEPAC